jgi:micrococcal nuclease
MKKEIRIVLIVALVLVFLLSRTRNYGLEGKEKSADSFKVEKVNDGDTITVRMWNKLEKIRLIGIDAPEMGQEPWGLMAREHLKGLIDPSLRDVILEYDIVKRDKYGRLLAYVRTANKKMLNAEMLRDGYAVLFTFPPNVKHTGEFIEVQRQAREKKLGIWGERGLEELPKVYRKHHPRNERVLKLYP